MSRTAGGAPGSVPPVAMSLAVSILAMLPTNAIGHSAVPAGQRIAEAAILVAFVAVGIVLALRLRRG
jgi:hypothetical protein